MCDVTDPLVADLHFASIISVIKILTMKSAAILALSLASANAFVQTGPAKQSTKLGITLDENSSMLEKIKLIVAMEDTPEVDPAFDKIVKGHFPNAISNQDLESGVVNVLGKKGFTGSNTLLATSLCCDELARKLEGTFFLYFLGLGSIRSSWQEAVTG